MTEEHGTTVAIIKCATHADRAAAEGGVAIIVASCPSANVDVTFRLVGGSPLDGALTDPPPRPCWTRVQTLPGPTDTAAPPSDAGTDGSDAAL